MRKIISDISEIGSVEAVTVIPSYHKGAWLHRVKNTFQYMCPVEDVPCVLFLQDSADVVPYDRWVPDHIIFWCPPVRITGIASAREYIQCRCMSQEIRILVLLDDDLRLTYRVKEPNKYYPVRDDYASKCSAKVCAWDEAKTYKSILVKAAHAVGLGYAVVSIVQRFGSQNKTKAVVNGRILHFFVMNLQLLHEESVMFSSEYPVCEDFRFLFDCAKAGLQTYTMTEFVQDDYTNAIALGGCNEWRNKDRARIHNESVKKLAADYPEFCKAVWEDRSPYCPTGAYNPRVDWKAVNKVANKESVSRAAE